MKPLLKPKTLLAAGVLIAANFALMSTASAHCDGLDGPVIVEAKAALEKKDVTPLLKWVPAKGERAVKTAFAKALSERTGSPAAREAADRKLFETLVRVHRESEGAPYTGIKPAGRIAPIVAEADAALAGKDVDHLAKHMAAEVEKAIRAKFEQAAHSRETADQSVDKGREFVANYVQYVHFVEEVGKMVHSPVAHHAAAGHAGGHKH